ncbi:MAG: enoyl-CoA hydratase-related protein [Aeromicrobium sp.]
MSDVKSQAVTYAVADGIATITLNRPDGMNSLTLETKIALKDAVHEAAADSAARCVVLTGTGRAFCVGQDLKEHVAGLKGDVTIPLSNTVTDHYNPTITAIASMPKPVIAAVNGVAAGAGASLALGADFRILKESAGYNLAFAAIALSCDTGISWTLPRIVGMAKATELLLFPRNIASSEALSLGLATTVLPDEEFDAAVATLARKLADGPTVAYASIKRSLAFSATHDLPASLDQEAQKMALTGATSDHLAAVEAFLAKEKPVFEGK